MTLINVSYYIICVKFTKYLLIYQCNNRVHNESALYFYTTYNYGTCKKNLSCEYT